MTGSALEQALLFQIRALGLPEPVREHRFIAEHVGTGPGVRQRIRALGLRDWRFDAAWPDLMLAAEIEGGGWVQGRHNRGEGFEADMKKYDAAMRLGWTVYRCDGRLIRTGMAVDTIKILIERMGGRI